MQGLVQPPRDGLSEDAVRSLLAKGPQVQVDQGCDLLDTSNGFVADISADMLVGGEVTHDNSGTGTAGKCQTKFLRQFAWGRDRIRPWVTLSDGVNTARVNLGVYVLTTPDSPRGEDPIAYDVQGYDLTSLLTDQVGDTYLIITGTPILGGLRSLLTAAGIDANVLLDGTAQDTEVPSLMAWCLYDGGPSWLTIANDLLSLVNYVPLWADQDGNFRSGPWVDPATQAPGWTFDTGTSDNIISPDRTLSEDLWSAPNSWKFIRRNMDTEPIEGDGIYIPPPNQANGPSSINSIGRTRRKVVYLDAADQASLVAQGDQIVAEDTAPGTKVTFSTFLPIAGHGDVVTFTDSGRSDKLPVASWTTNLDGSPGQWVLGGVKRVASTPLSVSAAATVTQASASGLRIVVDGATQDSPANSLDGAAYVVGDRVTCTIRNPVQPLVNGKET